jgi:hypothetical protein
MSRPHVQSSQWLRRFHITHLWLAGLATVAAAEARVIARAELAAIHSQRQPRARSEQQTCPCQPHFGSACAAEATLPEAGVSLSLRGSLSTMATALMPVL